MALRLSAPDLQRLERATRLLLSSHDHETVDGWRRAVNRTLCELLHADSAGFLLPTTDGPPFYSEEHDPAALARFPELFPPDLADGTPIWQRSLSLGVCTIATAYRADVARYRTSAYYHDYARPNGAADTLGASFVLTRGGGLGPSTAASLHLWRAQPGGRHAFGPRALSLLRLLFPAFRAGVEAERRFATARGSLRTLLDQLGHAVMICDRSGRMFHQTPALQDLLAVDPDAEMLSRALQHAARQLQETSAPLAQVARPVLRTQAGSYDLTLSLYVEPSGREPWVLVGLERRAPQPPTASDLRIHFGLTPAEARVALLLADGRSNADLAVQLGISPFTARRHTERVLAKLHVRSRAEAAARLHGELPNI